METELKSLSGVPIARHLIQSIISALKRWLTLMTKTKAIENLAELLLPLVCRAVNRNGELSQLRVRAEGGDGQLAIKLQLCEEDVKVKFAERHLIDLQEMIKKSQELERPARLSDQ